MKNLIPKPSDGKVRALFMDNKSMSLQRAGASSLLTGSRRANAINVSNYNSVQTGYTHADPLKTINTVHDYQQTSQMQQEKETQMLDLINRVQMFQIASSKVNQNLMQRKKNPVFNLQFTETFDQNQDQGESSQIKIDDDDLDFANIDPDNADYN